MAGSRHIHFVTFGSTPKYSAALARIEQQARQSGYFDTVTVYTQDTLPGLSAYAEFIAKHPRGYGYWFWKPLVILDRMADAGPDDIIVYADAGCGICTSPDAQLVWPIWCGIVDRHPTHRICFHHGHIEETWSKGDLSVLLGCANAPAIMKTPQAWAGIQMMRNTPDNQALMCEWLELMTRDDGHYVDDSPSRSPNAPGFREHRHDQAIISLLMKLRGSARLRAPYRAPVHPILCLQQRDS